MKAVLGIFFFFFAVDITPRMFLAIHLASQSPGMKCLQSYGPLSSLYQKQMGPEVWRTLPYIQQKSEANLRMSSGWGLEVPAQAWLCPTVLWEYAIGRSQSPDISGGLLPESHTA